MFFWQHRGPVHRFHFSPIFHIKKSFTNRGEVFRDFLFFLFGCWLPFTYVYNFSFLVSIWPIRAVFEIILINSFNCDKRFNLLFFLRLFLGTKVIVLINIKSFWISFGACKNFKILILIICYRMGLLRLPRFRRTSFSWSAVEATWSRASGSQE